MSDELTTLFKEYDEIVIHGETITIRPIGLGQMPKSIGFIQNIAASVGDISKDDLVDPQKLAHIFETAGEDLIQLLSYVLKKNRDWFDSVPPDLGMELIIKFIEVNMSFFLLKCLPLINKQLEKRNLTGQK